jgi:hypothetical protein
MSYPVTIEIDGRIVTGTFIVLGSTVTVLTSGGAVKTARMSGGSGGIDAERLARILLGELAHDGKA